MIWGQMQAILNLVIMKLYTPKILLVKQNNGVNGKFIEIYGIVLMKINGKIIFQLMKILFSV